MPYRLQLYNTMVLFSFYHDIYLICKFIYSFLLLLILVNIYVKISCIPKEPQWQPYIKELCGFLRQSFCIIYNSYDCIWLIPAQLWQIYGVGDRFGWNFQGWLGIMCDERFEHLKCLLGVLGGDFRVSFWGCSENWHFQKIHHFWSFSSITSRNDEVFWSSMSHFKGILISFEIFGRFCWLLAYKNGNTSSKLVKKRQKCAFSVANTQNTYP